MHFSWLFQLWLPWSCLIICSLDVPLEHYLLNFQKYYIVLALHSFFERFDTVAIYRKLLPLIGNSAGFMGSMDWEHNLQWVDQQFLSRELPWSCRKNNFVLAGDVSQFVTCVTQPHQGPPLVIWGSSKASRQWEDMFWMAYNHNKCWKKNWEGRKLIP